MSASISAAAICFIACHGGPADHFATFADELTQRGHQVEIYATGPALKKFQDRKIEKVTPFSLTDVSEEEKAIEMAIKCSKASIVITDVGHSFDVPLQTVLNKQGTLGIAYYDNPEPYVPGGYSETAAKVMTAAQGVFFANANLAKDDKNKIGIGYYPIDKADELAQKRASKEREEIRAALFKEWNLEDRGQKILVYTGGNNDEYFTNALPAFLEFLTEAAQEEDLSNFVVMIQQHPGALEKNREKKTVNDWMIKAPRIFLSKIDSDKAQIVADRVLYYQTSMGPQFVLAGIPTTQVGRKPYEDILVKNHLCSVATNSDELIEAITGKNEPKGSRETVIEGLGIRKDWADRLEHAISESISTARRLDNNREGFQSSH